MKKILSTERLYLRELQSSDAESFYLLNLDEEVIKYTGDKPFANVEQAKDFLDHYDQYEKHGVGRWAVIDQTSKQFLGWCGLKYTEDVKEYDIGFRFFRKYWNKGYATESARACMDYGHNELKINTILGRAMKDNAASVRVLEKIGLKFDREFDFEGSAGVIYVANSSSYSKS